MKRPSRRPSERRERSPERRRVKLLRASFTPLPRCTSCALEAPLSRALRPQRARPSAAERSGVKARAPSGRSRGIGARRNTACHWTCQTASASV
eukprot:scaffold6610_cov245-Pinguiococcus_pyrenoidosus.AAC.3